MTGRLLESMLDTIGNTPLVNLSRITKGLEGAIYAKIDTTARVLVKRTGLVCR